ncbi:SLC13 family permease [Winogradskyella sp. SM1960]|uniref:SLC13 family permease n=1 Tax=Winogradskyella sp. SM1960 TaxID=2865955 RepID=UPI001CD1DCAE|nr:SLC13 family permease [Winogradskyella sp. SM1960]
MKKNIGIILGFLLFVVIQFLPTPDGMSYEAKITAGVVVLMSVWWITEAVPVYVTAFVPLVLFPVFDVLSPSETASNYGHNYVLMFLAIFFLAKAIEIQNLHKRIALKILTFFGTGRSKIILSMMVATAFVSMWIANITTALMMLPIGLSIIEKDENTTIGNNNFATALMLAIAYSASIGGLATLIGSPTNMIFIGIFEKLFSEAPTLNFFKWLKIGVPVVIVFIPIFWIFIVKYFKISGGLSDNLNVVKEELKALGKIESGERRVLYIAVLTVFAWVFKDAIYIGEFHIVGWTEILGISGRVHDGTIAMASAILLFVVPANKNRKLLNWDEAKQVPWGVVIIVGGGYAVANGFDSTGLADWLGGQLTFVSDFSFFTILIVVIAFVLVFTEFNSNTASANILLPVLASTAVAASMNPLLFMVPATVVCSCAFMMPAATGPNTVVFASNCVTVPEMIKCGFWLNIIVIVLLPLIFYFFIIPWLGIELELPEWAMVE